jgi:transposase-like protein
MVAVQGPECGSEEVVRYGQQPNGEQRYRCNNPHCQRRIFLLQYHNTGWVLEVKQQMVEMALNGSGIRDTARVLGVSPTTVITTLKKSVGASPGEPRAGDCEGRITTRGGDPQGQGSRAGRNVVHCR